MTPEAYPSIVLWRTCVGRASAVRRQSKPRRRTCQICQKPRWRPYRVECTGSLPNSEVKRRRARLVLGWGTAREDLGMLSAFWLRDVTHCKNTRNGHFILNRLCPTHHEIQLPLTHSRLVLKLVERCNILSCLTKSEMSACGP